MGTQRIFRLFTFVTLCAFAAYSSLVDTQNRLREQYREVYIAADHQEVVYKSINSSVRVVSTLGFLEDSDITASSSGTYFAHNDRYYIITAQHSLIGECETTMIVADDFMYNCIDIVFLDHTKDIGIMEVEKIFNRIPITIDDVLQTASDAVIHTGVHENLLYTGYPQGHGPFTFDGKIVSHRIENGLFFAHSYAWSGSSGSGVFNSKGKLVGVLTAVSVANSEYGVDVMEDLIIITSIRLSDFQGVL